MKNWFKKGFWFTMGAGAARFIITGVTAFGIRWLERDKEKNETETPETE